MDAALLHTNAFECVLTRIAMHRAVLRIYRALLWIFRVLLPLGVPTRNCVGAAPMDGRRPLCDDGAHAYSISQMNESWHVFIGHVTYE